MQHPTRLIYLLWCILMTALISALFSCANMSRPSGGPRDTTPPQYITSRPLPDERNFNNKRIEIEFDEIIQVDKPSEKIIISPPQINMPRIQAQGRRLRIELQDSLLANTTYTIDFSNAIIDNNEKNPLEGFALSFSTGDSRDSLQISGILLNAEDLEPITGMLVGVYSNLEDSAFTTLPMERITASDAYGHFIVRNLKPGSYRVVALKDGNRNYFFDNNTEDIAFLDSIVVPYAEPQQYIDTLYTDSATIDTVICIDYNRYYPNNILLTAFNENKKSRFLSDKERKERNRLDFTFSTPHDSLPHITPLNFSGGEDWYVLERNATNDTLSYWVKDSLIYRNDTLKIALQYYRTDSAQQLSPYNDTITMSYRAPKTKPKRTTRRTTDSTTTNIPATVFAKMNVAISNKHDVHLPIPINFDTPIDSVNFTAFYLYEKRDTIYSLLPDSTYSIIQDSTNIRELLLSHEWKPEGSYRLVIDSMAVIDMYGLHTNKQERDFSIKSMQEYTNLRFNLIGVTDSAVVQLLSSADKPVATAVVSEGYAQFSFLKPGTYYARLFIDSNNNGLYDTGNYAEHRQPEEVYYYSHELELRPYWNVEQTWDIYNVAIDKQKPLAIKKNKPKDELPPEEEDDDYEHDPYSTTPGYGSSPGYGTAPGYGSSTPGMSGYPRSY